MKEERNILAYKKYFVDFISSLAESESNKVFYVLDMLKKREILSRKFVKRIEEGIFELRAESGGNSYRIFFIFDEGNSVLLLNGFMKKTQKIPRREIELAKKLKYEYYYEKGM